MFLFLIIQVKILFWTDFSIYNLNFIPYTRVNSDKVVIWLKGKLLVHYFNSSPNWPSILKDVGLVAKKKTNMSDFYLI
jgi:hypothetical protein